MPARANFSLAGIIISGLLFSHILTNGAIGFFLDDNASTTYICNLLPRNTIKLAFHCDTSIYCRDICQNLIIYFRRIFCNEFLIINSVAYCDNKRNIRNTAFH